MSTIDIEQAGSTVIARPTEDIDTASAQPLQETLAGYLDSDADHLILDLSEVRYLDSAGIHMLLRLGERLRERRSGLLVVIPESSPLRRLADIVNLPGAVPVYATVADALGESAPGGATG